MDGLPHPWAEYWPGYEHRTLYDMVRTDAAGPGSVGAADESWAQFAALMAESVEDVQQALAEAGASWEGLAAESMYVGVLPLAQWAQDAETAGAASSGSLRQFTDSFAHVATAMPEPVALPPAEFPVSFEEMFGGQTDRDAQERAAQEAKQRAVELMDGYSGDTDSATTSVGTFVPPQSVTVNVPPPNIGGPPIQHAGGIVEGPRGESPRPGGPPAPVESGPPPGGPPNPGPSASPGPVTSDGGQRTTADAASPVETPPSCRSVGLATARRSVGRRRTSYPDLISRPAGLPIARLADLLVGYRVVARRARARPANPVVVVTVPVPRKARDRGGAGSPAPVHSRRSAVSPGEAVR